MKEPRLPDGAMLVISRLNHAGHRADIVGGCVRDFLLGNTPSDYDITTDATPEQIKKVFFDLRTIDVGVRHGTVTVMIEGEPFEITTYRRDGEYRDHRHPETVSFTDRLVEDLSRRDFTMNAIAYNPKDGFTDLYHGTEDIKKSIIRAVGDPRRRFDEDALRILRAIRFSSVLNFDIESQTAAAAKECASFLDSISGERIAVEWKKLISGVSAYRVISEFGSILSEFLGLVEIRIPDRFLFDSSEPFIRELSIFALSTHEPAEAFAYAAERMKYDGKRYKSGVSVLSSLDFDIDGSDASLLRLLMRLGEDNARLNVKLRITLGKAEEKLLQSLNKVIEKNLPYRISDLKISGRELNSMGIKGVATGVALSRLLEMLIEGETENTTESLLAAALEFTDLK